MANRRYHFDRATLEFGHAHRMKGERVGVYSDDDRKYYCPDCGCSWQAEHIWAWWPVSVRMAHSWGFGWHGFYVSSDGIERHVFAQVWSIGPLRIVLGDRRQKTKL